MARYNEIYPDTPLLADDPAMSTRAAAIYLGTYPNRVYELIRAGELAAVKDGKRIRIRRSELNRYLASRPAYEPETA